MSKILKVIILIASLSGLAFFTAGCGTKHSNVRFVQAAPDANVVDVLVDGKIIAPALPFGGVSPASNYVAVEAGNRVVEVRPTGATTDLINSTIDFAHQKQYTLLAIELAPPPLVPPSAPPSLTALLKTDDNSPPTSGNVKLRVIHTAQDPTEPDDNAMEVPVHVDVYIVAPSTDITNVAPTILALGYQQASDYQSVAAGTYEFIVTNSADPAKVRLVDKTYDFTAGQIRTLVTVDVISGGAMAGEPLVLNDLN